MSQKQDLANACVNYASEMMSLAKKMEAINELYFDAGYNAEGSDPILDEDVANSLVTAAELGDFINFTTQLSALLNNGQPFQADWSMNLNKMRRVNIIG